MVINMKAVVTKNGSIHYRAYRDIKTIKIENGEITFEFDKKPETVMDEHSQYSEAFFGRRPEDEGFLTVKIEDLKSVEVVLDSY